MGAAPGAGWDEGEFEFKLVFEEESQGPSPVRTSEPDSSGGAEKNEAALDCSHASNLGSTHFSDDCMLKVKRAVLLARELMRASVMGSLYQFMWIGIGPSCRALRACLLSVSVPECVYECVCFCVSMCCTSKVFFPACLCV